MRMAPIPAPTPIPAFAPVDKNKPAEGVEEGLGTEPWAPEEVCDVLMLTNVREVCDGSEVVDDAVLNCCEAEVSVKAVAVGLEVDVPVAYLIPSRDRSESTNSIVIGCAHMIMEPVICTSRSALAPRAKTNVELFSGR
jgi:hypothetical protein